MAVHFGFFITNSLAAIRNDIAHEYSFQFCIFGSPYYNDINFRILNFTNGCIFPI